LHWNCFLREAPPDSPVYEKIGFADIEATGLVGDFDFMLSYCIKELGGKIYGRVLMPYEIRNYIFDKRLIAEFIKDLCRFDRIVVHYGRDRRYDIPFARTRALRWGVEFPSYKELKITDTYDIAKNKLKLHSNRLESICQHLKIPAKGHRLEPDIWQRANAGSKKDLQWIFTHNKEDVVSTEQVWLKLQHFVRRADVSI
jgi:uncharacterized protein YprB with RNaseH-like and TPR domain